MGYHLKDELALPEPETIEQWTEWVRRRFAYAQPKPRFAVVAETAKFESLVTFPVSDRMRQAMLADDLGHLPSISIGAEVRRYDRGDGIIELERTSAYRMYIDGVIANPGIVWIEQDHKNIPPRIVPVPPNWLELLANSPAIGFEYDLDRMEKDRARLAAFMNDCLGKPVPASAMADKHGPRNRKERRAAKAKPKGRKVWTNRR